MTVLGCITANGVGSLVSIDVTMYQEHYEEVLAKNVKQSAKSLKMRYLIFQQDNDPKHTASKVCKWFANDKINVLDWPPQSLDLNIFGMK